MHVSDSEPDTNVFPPSGRIAAIDYGTVRMGIAICDPDRILASPLDVYPAEGWRNDGEFFRNLVARERIVGFVVGLPLHCDGAESPKSAECREFARWLQSETGIPVRLFDERFTTADAKTRMLSGGYTRKKGKQRIDAVAALVQLESFLEACRYHGYTAGEGVDSSPGGGESLDT